MIEVFGSLSIGVLKYFWDLCDFGEKLRYERKNDLQGGANS